MHSRKLFKIALTALVYLMSGGAFAEEVAINAQLEKDHIALNESTTLTITVEGAQDAEPEISKVPDLVIYPSGQSQSISMINGKVSSSSVYQYTLQPKVTGTISIPPVQIRQGLKTYASKSLSLKVGAVSQKAIKSSMPEELESQATTNPDENAQDLFTIAQIDKKKQPTLESRLPLNINFTDALIYMINQSTCPRLLLILLWRICLRRNCITKL